MLKGLNAKESMFKYKKGFIEDVDSIRKLVYKNLKK